MGDGFAIISFRASGPIKTWSAMRGAYVHNSRTKPIKHAVLGAPTPRHLIGSGMLIDDVKRKLRSAGIDPQVMRRGGVIAYEAVMTASRQFFLQGSPREQTERLDAWVKAQIDFALERWGIHRVASMVLHLDEMTPHIHLIVLPLEVKPDRRRADPKAMRWSLVGRSISGPGRYDALQDDYSAAMAHFGLVRGIKGSVAKNEPMLDFIARTERAKADAAQQKDAILARESELLAEIEAAAVIRLAAANELAQVSGERAALQEKWDLARKQLASARERHAREVANQLSRLEEALAAADRFMALIAEVPSAAAHPTAAEARHAADELQRAALPAVRRRQAVRMASSPSVAPVRVGAGR